MFPGQLPNVRRDIHNVVIPVDLTNPDDIRLVVDYVLVFIKRAVPVRFGLVPTVNSRSSVAQLQVAHHLHDTYGLSALVRYLEEVS
jgi:UDP-glucose:glycoprotein glucosyltransferase